MTLSQPNGGSSKLPWLGMQLLHIIEEALNTQHSIFAADLSQQIARKGPAELVGLVQKLSTEAHRLDGVYGRYIENAHTRLPNRIERDTDIARQKTQALKVAVERILRFLGAVSERVRREELTSTELGDLLGTLLRSLGMNQVPREAYQQLEATWRQFNS